MYNFLYKFIKILICIGKTTCASTSIWSSMGEYAIDKHSKKNNCR